jgi:hypothetical protein
MMPYQWWLIGAMMNATGSLRKHLQTCQRNGILECFVCALFENQQYMRWQERWDNPGNRA